MSTNAEQLRQALSALRELRARLDKVERARTEPVAIIGIGCRVPGADGPEALWDLLRDGVDAISETPPDRWDNELLYDPDPLTPGKVATRWGGYLSDIDRFDAAFFGISPREAAQMDPQQRLLLEVSYEALEHAGQPLDSLQGSRTGVFLGIHSQSNDYFLMQSADTASMDLYSGTGTSHSVAAGRLSYLWDLRGPCVSIDTACSSSLVAVHLAVQSLRRGESNLALAGGVNVLLEPTFTIAASRMQMLAADGRCKTFDAAADGFVRSEGCGMVVLKRLSDAVADGDPIQAVIYGSAINQDGHSNGLTAPSGISQQAVIRDALRDGGIEPGRVGYVEAHGTGTSLGDPIEVEALGAVLGEAGERLQRCYLGSVKANLGHLEGAAGVTGLIKAVLTLRHGQIPPVPHFRTLNPNISLDGTSLTIPTELAPWPVGEQPRIAGVSSFGWSGTNAHVVLGDPPSQELSETVDAESSDVPVLLPISGRSEPALRVLAGEYAALLRKPDAPAIADLAFTAATRRSQLEERLAVVGDSHETLAERLNAFAAGNPVAGAFHRRAATRPPRLAFVFPGQGGQWIGMGLRLSATEPDFAAALARCSGAIEAETGWSLLEVLNAGAEGSRLDEIDVVQPAIFAMQVALADLLGSWGLKPDVVVGHSLGEVAAAHVAGILSLEDAAAVICRRSRLMKRVAGKGGMGVVELTLDEASDLVSRYGNRLAIAASNGPTTTVLAGDPEALDEALASVQSRGLFARRVQVDVASHSPHVEPLLDELQETLNGLAPAESRASFASTVTGDYVSGRELGASYWARNLRQPVLFGHVVDKLLAEGDTAFVELSPHPVLLTALESATSAANSTSMAVATLRRGQDEAESLREAVAALWTAGLPVNWQSLGSGRVTLPLPCYPWQRQRFWIDLTKRQAPSITSMFGLEADEPWLGRQLPELAHLSGSRFWQGLIDPTDAGPFPMISGMPVLPDAAAIAIANAACGGPVERVEFAEHVLLASAIETQTIVQAGPSRSEIRIYTRPVGVGEWSLWATASPSTARLDTPHLDIDSVKARLAPQPSEVEEIDEFWGAGTEALARLQSPPVRCAAYTSLIAQLVGAMDLAPGVSGALIGAAEYADLQPDVATVAWLYARRAETGSGLDLYLFSNDGSVVGQLRGAVLVEPPEELLSRASIQRLDDWLYSYTWRQVEADDAGPRTSGDWLVLAGDGELGRQIAAALEARGARSQTLTVCCDDIDERARQLKLALTAPDCDFTGIIDARNAGSDTRDPAEAELTALSSLDITQTLASTRLASLPRLWVVTRGAQAVDEAPCEPPAAGLWGFGRVVANEHPEFWGGLIDLDPRPSEADPEVLVDAVLTAGGETEIALRDRRRYVARLMPVDDLESSRPEIRANGTYLITGGAGGIGLAIAQSLVNGGARHLALVGRSDIRPEAHATITRLESAGATVRYLRGDVARRHDVDRIFETVRCEMPPLRGIVHAAGVLADATLLQQTPQAFRTVFAPKVRGADNLVAAARGLELDFLALFSSVSAILGVPGQSNYAAANAVLDAYARKLREEGVPAISIAWGRWGEIGLATQADSAASLDRLGIVAMPPAAGVAAFDRVSMSSAAHVAVLDIDWQAYLSQASVVPPRFSEIADRVVLWESKPQVTVRSRLDSADAVEREDILLDLVRELAATVLRFDDQTKVLPGQGFFQIGMDSLTAVELKNRLQQSLDLTLPATIAFDYPTPATLARRLYEDLFCTAGQEAEPGDVDDELNGLEEMSRDNLLDLLEAELQLLDEELG